MVLVVVCIEAVERKRRPEDMSCADLHLMESVGQLEWGRRLKRECRLGVLRLNMPHVNISMGSCSNPAPYTDSPTPGMSWVRSSSAILYREDVMAISWIVVSEHVKTASSNTAGGRMGAINGTPTTEYNSKYLKISDE